MQEYAADLSRTSASGRASALRLRFIWSSSMVRAGRIMGEAAGGARRLRVTHRRADALPLAEVG